ncbi:MAG: anhydro-N-acetylmuramic acid kinase [Granulosicoccus sp.]
MSQLKNMGLNKVPETHKPVWAVGLMTGTVLDGNIDVALLKTDGQVIERFGCYTLAPYRADTVEMLRECQSQALKWQFDGPEPVLFAQTEKQLTLEQSAAVVELLKKAQLTVHDVGVVGFHGQTVLHRPPVGDVHGKTRQLGDGALMARTLGIDVVHDFRSADMRAGGQGAPLSAIYHKALLEQIDAAGDTAVLNLGGVGNLSWWDGTDRLYAFDTGPANAPINDFVRGNGYGEFDEDGRFAAEGRVDEARLSRLLEHPYLRAAPPKSLDRFDFSSSMADGCNLSDGAALLTAFSAAAVSCALDVLPQRPQRLIVCGGGRHNTSLMQALAKRCAVLVEAAEDVGWRGDAMEAECFAYLAVRAIRALPSSFPETTGVQTPMCCGVVNRVTDLLK